MNLMEHTFLNNIHELKSDNTLNATSTHDDDNDYEPKQKYSFLKTYPKVLLLNMYILRERILCLVVFERFRNKLI